MASLKGILEEYGYIDREEKQEAKDIVEEICGEDFTASQFDKWRSLIFKYDIELSGDFEEDIQLYQNYYDNEDSEENSYKLYSILIKHEYDLDIYSDFHNEYEDYLEIDANEFEKFLGHHFVLDFELEDIFNLYNEAAEYDMNDSFNKKAFKLLCSMRKTLDSQDISFEDAQTILEDLEGNN